MKKLFIWIRCKVFNQHPDYHVDYNINYRNPNETTIERCCDHCFKTISSRKANPIL